MVQDNVSFFTHYPNRTSALNSTRLPKRVLKFFFLIIVILIHEIGALAVIHLQGRLSGILQPCGEGGHSQGPQ